MRVCLRVCLRLHACTSTVAHAHTQALHGVSYNFIAFTGVHFNADRIFDCRSARNNFNIYLLLGIIVYSSHVCGDRKQWHQMTYLNRPIPSARSLLRRISLVWCESRGLPTCRCCRTRRAAGAINIYFALQINTRTAYGCKIRVEFLLHGFNWSIRSDARASMMWSVAIRQFNQRRFPISSMRFVIHWWMKHLSASRPILPIRWTWRNRLPGRRA